MNYKTVEEVKVMRKTINYIKGERRKRKQKEKHTK